ncbi:MAG: hypothetical protein EOM85_02380 [Candidatus Moranbacteria bacterium]|nr:hypothetical protein [Candidatus Moranbacteria bacterium]
MSKLTNNPDPNATAQKDGMVVLRDLADSSGTVLGWDAKSKNVITATGQYTPDQIKSMGGVLTDGRWALPESQAKQLLGANSQPAPQQNINDMINQISEGYVASQTASLAMDRDAEIARIKADLDQAVLDGKLSVREAETQFEAQKSTIEGQAYQDSERTTLYGEEMGIKNSQQMLGVRASDQARTTSLINKNVKDRDTKILNIQDRIAALKSKAQSDISYAQSKYEAGVTGAKGQAQLMAGEQGLAFAKEDYFTDKSQNFQTSEREASQEYASGERELDRDFEKSMTELNQAHQITMQGNEFRHDAKMTAQKFQNDLKAMATQFGYDSSLIDKRTESALAEHQSKLNMDYSMALKQANTDLINEYKKYNDPNSLEYRAYKAKVTSELNDKFNMSYQETLANSMIEMKLSKSPEFSQKDLDDIKASVNWFTKFNYSTDLGYQHVFDKTIENIKNGTPKETAYKQVKGASGVGIKNSKIEEIVDRMYADKEWTEAYDVLIQMMDEGLFNN